MKIGKKLRNKKSLQEFFVWSLTDDKVVLKILFTCAFWGAVIICLGSALVFTYFKIWILAILFWVLLILAFKKLYDFRKLGGLKNLEGMTMGNLVYGEEKINEVFKK